ncbi:BglG family transcription antiterminator [Alloiococcus sp. CFN-8]|uniref:BglG family transcription antiterminator n=1 Tax=Alloiococcus sp. CFN-8 TaxID=3416081 RepID=UPI003CFAD726
MKDREKKILDFIIENERVTLKELLEEFKVSKRTLYYDIKSINYKLSGSGKIENLDHKFTYSGSLTSLIAEDIKNKDKFIDGEYRRNYIIYEILNERDITIDKLSELMGLSRNTIALTFEGIREELMKKDIRLVYNKGYTLEGEEGAIRDLFLLLMQEDESLLTDFLQEVLTFNKENSLKLTDYSLASLSKFIRFLNKRIEKGRHLEAYDLYEAASNIDYYPVVSSLISSKASPGERAYLTAYISSLSSLNTVVEEKLIEEYTDTLIKRFEGRTAINLESKEVFKKNLIRHLLSSYNRIRFGFPISSAALEEIKGKHSLLYDIVKDIIRNEKDFPSFKGIREEEIALIAAYIGGYIKGSQGESTYKKNKVILVCPNGLTVSKILEIQIKKYVPNAEIISTLSLNDLEFFEDSYDHIVTTTELKAYPKAIMVHPILTKPDIELLRSRIVAVNQSAKNFDFQLILQAVKRNAVIKDEKKLMEELSAIIYNIKKEEGYQPMLEELLSEKRINKIKRATDWKEAIRIAAKPLLEDKSIEELYVNNMIASVERFGPYIVLADGFALPHASSKEGVNDVAMSLLTVEEEVDLLGEKVKAFMVLATVDNTSHIKALAELSELLYSPENLQTFLQGDSETILKLIRK